MSPKRILVIAPDSDLRHSLRFALEAEGFKATMRTGIDAPLTPADYDCVILDHHGLDEYPAAADAFVADFAPVILLANRQHRLSSRVFMTLVKPDLGSSVIDAVRLASRVRVAPK